jgi:hypothetical protein
MAKAGGINVGGIYVGGTKVALADTYNQDLTPQNNNY